MQDILNGVDRGALFATIDALTDKPALARFDFRIANEWVDGGLNRSTITDFDGAGQTHRHVAAFTLYNDEPAVLLSGDRGPNPVENLLHALAGCVVTTIVYHAAARGMKIDAIRTRFEGDIDLRALLNISQECRRGYRQITISFDIEGDLTLEQKRELMAMGPQFSPVFDVVSNGTPVHCQLREDAMAIAAE